MFPLCCHFAARRALRRGDAEERARGVTWSTEFDFDFDFGEDFFEAFVAAQILETDFDESAKVPNHLSIGKCIAP